jgi:hypothetical protein
MCHHPDCGCEQHFHHAPPRGWHHRWGCCCRPGYAPRRFPTKEEIIEDLEEYLKQLRAEAKGVEERITDLKKGEA